MLESKFALQFRHWLKANPRMMSATFELKQTSTHSLPFSAVEDHQIDYALAIRGDKGVLIRVQGVGGEPDYVYLRGMPSFFVVKYPKFFCVIDPETFVLERKRSKRRSLTGGRAKEISIITVNT